MKQLMFYFCLITARLISFLIKLREKNAGTSFAGMLVLKFMPDFLKQASKYTNNIITVTGTNGKTTTSGVLSHILETASYKTLNNSKGANMMSGIATTFAVNVSPFNKFDYTVLEADEAHLSKLYDTVKSDYLIVTNLFPDQLDRYGDLSFTANKIKEAINKNQDLKLILNADDPVVASFGKNRKADVIYYCFNNIKYINNTVKETYTTEKCPECGEELIYSKHFYGHQGVYNCEKCGYKHPECKYTANVEVYDSHSVIIINYDGKEYRYTVNLIGLYNAYNALAAICAAFENNIPDIQTALDTYKSAFGRSEIKLINSHNVILQLIKNPTGANEVLKTINPNSKILIMINDNYADGRDMSWLWDTDFELLNTNINEIIASGSRAYDVAVRLKQAGIQNIKVMESIEKAVKYVLSPDNHDDITILPSYTALTYINNKGV